MRMSMSFSMLLALCKNGEGHRMEKVKLLLSSLGRRPVLNSGLQNLCAWFQGVFYKQGNIKLFESFTEKFRHIENLCQSLN